MKLRKTDYITLVALLVLVLTIIFLTQPKAVTNALYGTPTPTLTPSPTPIPNLPPLFGNWTCDESDEVIINLRNAEGVEVSGTNLVNEDGYQILWFEGKWLKLTFTCNPDYSVHRIKLETRVINGMKPPPDVVIPSITALMKTVGIKYQQLPNDGTLLEGPSGWITGKVGPEGGVIEIWGKRGGITRAGHSTS